MRAGAWTWILAGVLAGKQQGYVVPAILIAIAAAASPAHAASDDRLLNLSLQMAVVVFAMLVFFWALTVVRGLMKRNRRYLMQIGQLETQINDHQAVLMAEPHRLIVWRDRYSPPERIIGDLRDTVIVPSDEQDLLDFDSWLEPESSAELRKSIKSMLDSGSDFDIAVGTLNEDLLEVDGRAAGGMALVRLRPLSGDRRQAKQLAYDNRRLLQQVEQLSTILNKAPLPIWLRDNQDKLEWINQAYLSAVDGESKEEVIKANVAIFENEKLDFQPLIEASEDLHCARAHAVIDGEKRALDIYDVALSAGNAGFAIDMTTLEATEKELEHHVRAHDNTLDKLTAAVAIFGVDHRLRYYNHAYMQVWGLDEAWLETKPLDSDILDQLRSARLLPEQADYRTWKQQQLNVFNTLEEQEDWWHLPDGRSVRVIAQQHPFGGATFVYEDVTETVLLKSRYNEMINTQRETLDNLHEGVALFGTDGCLKLYNPSYAQFWSLDRSFLDTSPHVDAVISECCKSFDEMDHWDSLKYALTEVSGNRQGSKGRIDRADNRVFEYATLPLPDGDTIVTYMDMTDRAGIEKALRERNEALEAADRVKTGFLSTVSYELRTPLTNIIGFSEAMGLGMTGEISAKQEEYLQHIKISSEDLLTIIDAILDLTSIDAGALELDCSELPVVDLLTDAAEAMDHWIGRYDMKLNIELTEEVDHFIGDRKRINKILANLLSNAIGFSEEGSIIRMGAREEGDDIVIWVADTGRGMDAEARDKAFDRFHSKPASGRHRGPGLGLSIVKSFVELHGGSVTLKSKPDKGTTVICRFPLSGPVDIPEPHADVASPSLLAGQGN